MLSNICLPALISIGTNTSTGGGMKERILQVIWTLFLLIIACAFVGIPTYKLGLIGWFIGIGFLMTVIIILWILEATINYIIYGFFKPKGW